MASRVAESAEGVVLLNLNWGYQIVHAGYVLFPVVDAVMGPERTPHCTERAQAAYESLAYIYKRLYAAGTPTNAQLAALAAIVRRENLKNVHLNVLLALHKKGIVTRKWKLIGGPE